MCLDLLLTRMHKKLVIHESYASDLKDLHGEKHKNFESDISGTFRMRISINYSCQACQLSEKSWIHLN